MGHAGSVSTNHLQLQHLLCLSQVAVRLPQRSVCDLQAWGMRALYQQTITMAKGGKPALSTGDLYCMEHSPRVSYIAWCPILHGVLYCMVTYTAWGVTAHSLWTYTAHSLWTYTAHSLPTYTARGVSPHPVVRLHSKGYDHTLSVEACTYVLDSGNC